MTQVKGGKQLGEGDKDELVSSIVIPWTILFEDLITIVFMGEFIKNISMKKLAYTGKCGKCKYHADAELIKKKDNYIIVSCLWFYGWTS